MIRSSSPFRSLTQFSNGTTHSKTCVISFNAVIAVIKNESAYVLAPPDMQRNNETVLVRACDCISTIEAYCSEATTFCQVSTNTANSDIHVICIEEQQSFLRYLFAFLFFSVCLIFITCMRSPKGHTILRFCRRCMLRCCKTRHDRVLDNDLRSLEQDYVRRQNAAMIQRRAQRLQQHRSYDPWGDTEIPLALQVIRVSRIATSTTTRQVSALLRTKRYEATEVDYVCPVCLIEIEDGDRVGDLTCGHAYHVDCLKAWLKRKNICPLCKLEGLAAAQEQIEVEATTTNPSTD